tara:strand:- start:82620 stop:83843 length:1224 start_codon:yes stop_codon:yes gene_type:complete
MNNQVNKIINDPVYGFITLNKGILLEIIDHPFFQRLSRIKQLGLTYMVYPGAHHTRFHHAIGSAYLMKQALQTLKEQGKEISNDEELGVTLAILLHDIGHGPFSHALEKSFLNNLDHEAVSLLFMEDLNKFFSGTLSTAIAIFKDEYPKKFLHKLVSSQLDMDRLDYLKRDSFFTGVSEGVVSNERIIKMFALNNNEIVIREKGIYSIEKFLIARRLMYWQVYLHKTVLSAEFLLEQIINRARQMIKAGEKIFVTDEIKLFLSNKIDRKLMLKPENLKAFSIIDDFDVLFCVKSWCSSSDRVLSLMCKMMINRKLPKVKISPKPFSSTLVTELKRSHKKKLGLNNDEIKYFVYQKEMQNNAYSSDKDEIKILFKDGSLKDITEASDNLNIRALSNVVKKYYLFSPSF